MDNQTVFKDRLIEAIKSKGLTQTKLGELMKVNQATISRWLNGKREQGCFALNSVFYKFHTKE